MTTVDRGITSTQDLASLDRITGGILDRFAVEAGRTVGPVGKRARELRD